MGSPRARNYVGRVFGRLTVLRQEVRQDIHGARFVVCECVCECGNTHMARGQSLKVGSTRSCGCLNRETFLRKPPRRTHGTSGTRLYRIWCHMRARGDGREAPRYYAERGIKLCEAWQTYEPFRDWSLANGYTDHLTIDRIDNDLGYAPENCQWRTQTEQMNNTRRNRFLTYQGETRTVAEWARHLGIGEGMLRSRLRRGIPLDRALTSARLMRNHVNHP